MPIVILRAPLKDLAGGNHRLVLPGATVGEVIGSLERAWPRTAGWIVDEHGAVRQHVNVFCNGERVDSSAAVRDSDLLHILPSITGGS